MYKLLYLALLTTISTSSFSFTLGAPLISHESNEIIVSLNSSTEIFNTRSGSNLILSYKKSPNTRSSYTSLIKYSFNTKIEAEQAAEAFLEDSSVNWVQPNYIYEGDPREQLSEIFDPLFKDQKHHNLMQNTEAWKLVDIDKTVVVALTDDGVEITHEDLKNSIWQNEKEIPNNNIDDDQNGFIDDYNGWNFSDDNNDVSPKGEGHGTHLAGIISAEKNEIGVVGSAPGIKVMPIRFFGGVNGWNSEVVAKSYVYAIKNGAKIINTSYSTDYFVADKVFLEAVSYAKLKNVIVFNSAGNSKQENPKRLKMTDIVFVSSTNTDKNYDRKSSYSNFGYEVDISAPGQNIWSTYLNDSYRSQSGTSMACPNAVSVAALIWSKFPTYSREQVIARLIGTADDINSKNSRYRYKLGSGRVNSFRAVTEVMGPPQVVGLEKINNGDQLKILNSIKLILKNTLLPEGINKDDTFSLRNIDTDEPVPFNSSTYHHLLGNAINISFAKLKSGNYQFKANSKNMIDPFGSHLDGNKDGVAGDDFVVNFSICKFCY